MSEAEFAVPIGGHVDGLTLWEITIAELLSAQGYATGMWGNGISGTKFPESRLCGDLDSHRAIQKEGRAVLAAPVSYPVNVRAVFAPVVGGLKCWNGKPAE